MNQIFISAQNFDLFWKPNCKVLVAKFLCKKSNSILPNSGAFPANSNQQHPKSSCCPRLGNALETPDFWVPPPLTCWKWERERERESEWRFCKRSFIVFPWSHCSITSFSTDLCCYKKASKNLSLPIHLTTIPTENTLLVHHGPPAFSAQVGFEGLGSSAPLAERWSKPNSARQLFESGKTGTSGQSTFDASSLAWSLPPWCSDNPTSKSLDMLRLPHRNARMPVAMKSCWIQELSQCRTHCILPLLYLEPKGLTTREEGNKIEELNSFQEIKGPPSTVKKVWPKMGLVKLCP